MEKRDTAYIEGRMFIFYTVQKDSGILYKRWDAINLDMRMNTRGGKESKDREGGENGEKAGESRQMLLSRRETSLIRCKKFICVGEKKYIEAGGVDVGANGGFRCAPQYTRVTRVTARQGKPTMSTHCDVKHAE